MLESLQTNSPTIAQPQGKPQKILRWVENERMGGKVPVWVEASSEKEKVASNLAIAQNGGNPASENLLAYNGQLNGYDERPSEEFGFGDLIDMVNPLHHIPVVGHIYREVTGDEIKPIGNIIGGAVFGGPLGAAGGLVNTIIEEETGKDLTGNAIAMVVDGQMPKLKNENVPQSKPQEANPPEANPKDITENPEVLLTAATERAKNPYGDLPASLLSFADLSVDPNIKVERIDPAKQTKRLSEIAPSAGGFKTYKISREDLQLDKMPPREPITNLKLSGLYAL